MTKKRHDQHHDEDPRLAHEPPPPPPRRPRQPPRAVRCPNCGRAYKAGSTLRYVTYYYPRCTCPEAHPRILPRPPLP